MTRIALCILVAVLMCSLSGAQQQPPSTSTAPQARRAVLVTGASTGIGRKTAEVLAANGFFVYACARKDADLKALNAIENIQAIRLDVTKPDEIAAAVKTVRDGGRGLYGLINNAGVAVVGPLIELSDEDLAYQLDVNVHGPFRVTKAFAPLLIESKGRIATTGSISGIVSGSFGGAYCMSKHAIEAYTDALAEELEPFGVQVSVVEPGSYQSEIGIGVRQRLVAGGYGGEGSRYKEQIQQLLAMPADRADEKEPNEVAQAFLHALSDEKPKRRYMVVPNQEEAEITIKAAIRRAVQLNAEQPYSYDREGMIKLLDEAMSKVAK
ncbi:MAG: SDR family oxidoreductase [Phycisphaerae bacterium]|nr:SDR family oxidoreductase [Phycisphaerae bacterium]